MSSGPFLALPPFTKPEGEAILSAIAQAIAGYENILTVSRAPAMREAIGERVAALWSVRTAFAEAIQNHHD